MSSSTPQRQMRQQTPTRSRRRTQEKKSSEQGDDILVEDTINSEDLRKPVQKEEKKDKISDSKILKKVHGFARKINPINISYTENVNKTGMGVLGDIPLGYRLGLSQDHGLDYSKQVGSSTGNFDHKRSDTTIEHLITDYKRDIGEDDMTHYDEIIKLHDLNMHPGIKINLDEHIRICKDNFKNRNMHHHIFSQKLIFKMLEFCNFEVINYSETNEDLITLCQKKFNSVI